LGGSLLWNPRVQKCDCSENGKEASLKQGITPKL
jgi:hypothetical protein